MNIIKTYYSRHKGLLISVIGLGLFSNALKLAIPLCVGKFYQLALDGGSARSGIFDALFGNVQSINIFFSIFFGILLLRFIVQFAEQYLIGMTGETFSAWLRETLFTKQLHTVYSVFTQKDPGKYLLRYSGDMSALRLFITKGQIGAITDFAFLIMTIGLFGWLNITLTYLLLIAIPAIFLISILINRFMRPSTEKRRDINATNLNFVSERLHAMATIKVMNRSTPEINKFQRNSTKLLEAGKVYQFWNALNKALYPFLLYLLLAFVMLMIYKLLSNNTITADGGTLLIFVMLIIQIIPVVKRLLRSGAIRESGKLSLKKCKLLLEAPEDSREGHAMPVKKGDIRINNLSIKFGGKTIFENASFHFPPKGITLISGTGGSGKSTLLKYISGLTIPESGEIMIDDASTKSYSIFQVRKKITFISQELPLIGKHVYDAISYNRDPDKKHDAMQILSAIGFCDKFQDEVLELPLEKGGANFSTSQQQLLRIARGLITGKKIILLDEPFEGLDDRSARQVAYHLTHISSSHTIILVSKSIPETLFIQHRISLDKLKQPNV